MSNLWHFGDSYGVFKPPSPHFINICADNIGYNYIHNCYGGFSNEMIFSNILKYLSKFKNGDIIFINWSFFVRGSFWNSKSNKIESTNIYYYEMGNTKMDIFRNDDTIDKALPLIEYYLNYTEDYNRRIFELINPVFKFIESIGVKIFYIFVDDSEYVDDLLIYGTSIKFKNGFGSWLKMNGFHKEQDVHYTKGIQLPLADMVLNKTNNFNTSERIINCSITDFNKNLIIKTDNLL